MAKLEQILREAGNGSDVVRIPQPGGEVARLALHTVVDFLNKLVWPWYEANKDVKLKTFKFLFLTKTVYVRDLRELLTAVLGEPKA